MMIDIDLLATLCLYTVILAVFLVLVHRFKNARLSHQAQQFLRPRNSGPIGKTLVQHGNELDVGYIRVLIQWHRFKTEAIAARLKHAPLEPGDVRDLRNASVFGIVQAPLILAQVTSTANTYKLETKSIESTFWLLVALPLVAADKERVKLREQAELLQKSMGSSGRENVARLVDRHLNIRKSVLRSRNFSELQRLFQERVLWS